MLLRSCLKFCTWLQQNANQEPSDVQAGFRKGRGTRDKIANIHWIIEKTREFQKNIYLCFIDYNKASFCLDHDKLWKALREMGIPDHLTCLLRNLYEGQEATVKTLYGITDWFKIKKGVRQHCLLSCGKVRELVAQSCPILCDPWTVAHQAPLSMEFSRQEYWSG